MGSSRFYVFPFFIRRTCDRTILMCDRTYIGDSSISIGDSHSISLLYEDNVFLRYSLNGDCAAEMLLLAYACSDHPTSSSSVIISNITSWLRFWIGLHGVIELTGKWIRCLEPHEDHSHQDGRKVLYRQDKTTNTKQWAYDSRMASYIVITII